MSLGRALLRRLLALDQGAELQASTCLHMADTVGIALAATRLSGLLEPLLESQATADGPCHVLGLDRGLPPAQAAFVNAALAHALDFDDIHDAARLHPTPVCFSAALAAAEYAGADDPAQLLRATALGNELMCRLGLACAPTGSGPVADWFLTQLFGYAGAALSAGLLLGLDEEGLVSALGLACMQAAGSKQAGMGTGSNARAIYPAFAAQGGVQAALMARAGFSGPAEALDGAAGLLRLYLGMAPEDAAAALLQMRGWQALDIDFKPWPCCRISHPYVAAAFALRARLQGRSPQRLRVLVNASARRLCEPLAGRCRPRTLQDAKYSIPFMTAFALHHGAVDLDRLDERALRDEAVLALAARIELDPSLADMPGHPPARVQAQLQDGVWLDCGADPALLAPAAAQLRAKFIDAAGRAGHARPQALWALWLDAHRGGVGLGAMMRATRIAG